jgi:hypothetical protein
LTLALIRVQLRPVSRGRAGQLGIALWGVGGVLLLFGQALVRLTPIAWEALTSGTLTSTQWALYVGWVVVSAYTEGYRAFQKGFAPRVVKRAFELAAAPRSLFVVLAPAYCMTLFAAPRTRMLISWTVNLCVVAAVVYVRKLSQPWRGIIDGGVVVGLSWGVVCMVREFVLAYSAWSHDPHAADASLT